MSRSPTRYASSTRKISSAKNAEFSIGKVKHGNEMVDSFLIELTPEMLTPYVQYFKHGGLVEKIPQYNPLRRILRGSAADRAADPHPQIFEVTKP